jgi:hypothetical protein
MQEQFSAAQVASFVAQRVVLLPTLRIGCVTQRDREVKAHVEGDYERYHEQLEKERALDAYRHSAEYKAKVLRDLDRGMFGNSRSKEKVVP